jgi:hypothetical protein
MKNCTLFYKDGRSELHGLLVERVSDTVYSAELADVSDYRDIDYIDFNIMTGMKAGDDGFYVIPQCMGTATSPRSCKDYGVGYYREREDDEYTYTHCVLPVYCVKHLDKSMVAIVTGLPYDQAWRISIKDNVYTVGVRFLIKGANVYEAPKVEYHAIEKPDATYADMARVYREYQLAHGFRPIKDRLNPDLKYMAEFKFEKKGTDFRALLLSVVIFLICAAFIAFFLPDLLQFIDNIIGIFDDKKNIIN